MPGGFRFFQEEADFQRWFVDCVIAGAKNKDCPDDYIWDMHAQCNHGGEWMDMFRGGLSAKTAVGVKFSGLKLNS